MPLLLSSLREYAMAVYVVKSEDCSVASQTSQEYEVSKNAFYMFLIKTLYVSKNYKKYTLMASMLSRGSLSV
jgi:hypothetical protein